INQAELDVSPRAGEGYRPKEWKTTSDLVQLLDDSAALARDALARTSDEHLQTAWRLLAGGRMVDESPRHVVVADTFSHIAHHRGQLTVYLRLNGIPVPSVYGPTADE